MERLTSWNGDCVRINGRALHTATVGDIVQMAERLAEYEDSRLSPKACAEAREIEEALSGSGMSISRMVELMREDVSGKNLTLPCRPGDTVWLSQLFYTRPKKPIPVTVDAARIDRNGVTIITGKRRFCEEAFGKTVFFTEDDARKAWKEMEEIV